MFKTRKPIPAPPEAAPEPPPELFMETADHGLVQAQADTDPAPAQDVSETSAEPAHALEPVEPLQPVQAPAVPVHGLTEGRIVHLTVDHNQRAGVVARVVDEISGECDVFVFEPVAPPRVLRLVYAGTGTDPGPGQWAYPGRE